MGYKSVNIESWYRKEAHLFFKDFDDPFFNLTAPIKITSRLNACKNSGESFLLHTIHSALKVINTIEEFRMRIKDNELIIYDTINGGSTILNDDKSFSFSYFDYTSNIGEFLRKGLEQIEKTKLRKGFEPKSNQLDMIHFSPIPWISFTSFKHARNKNLEDTIPKIVFGKYFQNNGDWYMPTSVEVHHSIMDGYHVGLFFEHFEKEMDC